MRFIDRWSPLIVCVREGRPQLDEVAQLSAGFESYFERGVPYAVLTVSHAGATAPSAEERRRLADWANHERVRRLSRELCVGSATVVAREWERHALVALSWLWKPVIPHQVVTKVGEGVSFCLSSLLARRVRLPVGREALAAEIQRVLAAEDVAGVDVSQRAVTAAGGAPASTRGASPASARGALETLSDAWGTVHLGWVAGTVLWARFERRLSRELGISYVARLAELLAGRRGVHFFIDASALDSYELTARDATMRALMDHRQCFSRLVLLNWSGGMSRAARARADDFGAAIEVVAAPSEFEGKLRASAPLARARISGVLSETPSRRG